MQCVRAPLIHLSLYLLPQPAIDRGNQIQIRQRGLEPETGASDDYGQPPVSDQLIYLRMGYLGVHARAHLLARIDESDQSVLQLLLLPQVGCAADRLEAAIDLNRVAVHSNRALPPLSQYARHLYGDTRLPYRGRSEERDHRRLCWTRPVCVAPG